MKKTIFSLFLIAFSFVSIAQDDITNTLKALSDKQEYSKIIKQYTTNTKAYSAKALYYIGLAYYMKEDDNNCIKFIDQSIAKDATDPGALYIKASTLNYMGKFEEAIATFRLAIQLKADDAVFYSGMGDAFYKLAKSDSALAAYQKATEQTNCPFRPYSMIAAIYADRKENEKALQAYYTAKSKTKTGSDEYTRTLFNIGLFEYLKGNDDKAEQAFLELIKTDADDYHAIAKLIQVYYHRKAYDSAKPYRNKLYEAHRQGKLKDNLQNMFCFDQFTWQDKLVQAYERFEEGKKKEIYNKHLFYILDSENKILFRIQTEYSPISVEMGGPKYVLCMNKENMHATYGIGFNDDLKYEDLKQAVIDILEGKLKPMASSRTGG
ncbi:MAG: tetratricopeptide repeat protein [Bacteroidetes bacterium]|nr:tetratricopeptide repeat protein [Bacteroidota bacterium]